MNTMSRQGRSGLKVIQDIIKFELSWTSELILMVSGSLWVTLKFKVRNTRTILNCIHFVVNKLGCVRDVLFHNPYLRYASRWLWTCLKPSSETKTCDLDLCRESNKVLRLQLWSSGGHQIMLSVCLCQTHFTTCSSSISSQVVVWLGQVYTMESPNSRFL